MSGHGKKPIDRGALTSWRRQRDRPVKTQKETDQPRHTHSLETAEGGTYQVTERNRPTEAHSLTGDGRERDLSGHRKKPTNRGTLTFWRWRREGPVRTRKETDRPRRTHQLETAEEGTCQDTETNPPTEADSLPGDSRGRDLSGHGRNRPTEAHSHPGDGRGRDLSGHRKELTDQGALTFWRRQREGLVRTRKETHRPRHTHSLETAEGGTCQDAVRNRPTKAHSLPGDSRGRDLSGHRTKLTDRGALTS